MGEHWRTLGRCSSATSGGGCELMNAPSSRDAAPPSWGLGAGLGLELDGRTGLWSCVFSFHARRSCLVCG